MRTNFDKAFDLLMELEGGFVDDSKDAGGATKYGISKRAYPDEDIKNLTPARAKELYLRDYWIPAKCDDLSAPWDIVVFDTAVNMGVGTATLLSSQSTAWQDMLLFRLRRYVQIVGRNPSQVKFLRGWMNRVIRLWEVAK